jgi:hypothetical protein
MDTRTDLKGLLDKYAGPYQQDLLERLCTFVESREANIRAEKVKLLTPKPGDVIVFTASSEGVITEYEMNLLRDSLQRISGAEPGKLAVLFLEDDMDVGHVTGAQRKKLSDILGITDAMESARHDLTTLHGLVATDKPGAKMSKFSFKVNVSDTLAKIDALFPPKVEPVEAGAAA